MTRREFLAGLTVGAPVRIDMGSRGTIPARVSAVHRKVVDVKFGREKRRFSLEDGGTFRAPTNSKSWLLPAEE